MEYDYKRLREDLISEIWAASMIANAIMMELVRVENANEEELLNIAIEYGFNLDEYQLTNYRRF